jgi:hypothetical protein
VLLGLKEFKVLPDLLVLLGLKVLLVRQGQQDLLDLLDRQVLLVLRVFKVLPDLRALLAEVVL